jgi:hypothetical protein
LCGLMRTRVLHGGTVAKNLPARPNLDHLRSQAKTLLADLRNGDRTAARTFLKYLPQGARHVTGQGPGSRHC